MNTENLPQDLECNKVIQDHLKVLNLDLFNRFTKFGFNARFRDNAILLEDETYYYNFHVVIEFRFSGEIMKESFIVRCNKILKGKPIKAEDFIT